MRLGWHQLHSWTVLSVMLGLSLLTAVALKGYEIATSELLEDGLLTSRWFLILVVEWETFFSLWLLGGFYLCYPRTTRWVALLYFFTLFVVALDSALRGRASCPCFGKAIIPPWVAAMFDLAVLFLVAVVPVPLAFGKVQQRYQWLGLAGVFSAFGLMSLITMEDYSTPGVVPSIRRDARLFAGVVSIQRVRPTTEEMLALLRSATGLKLTVAERLQNIPPDYGVLDLKAIQPWAVMEMLAHRQAMPSRWKKRGEEYTLTPAAFFGKKWHFWFVSAVFLALAMMGLRWRDWGKEREKAVTGIGIVGRVSLADVTETSCR